MIRRSYIKEGSVQLTSLDSLTTHSRYLFLFNDLLLITKRKLVTLSLKVENASSVKNLNSYKIFISLINISSVWWKMKLVFPLPNTNHSFQKGYSYLLFPLTLGWLLGGPLASHLARARSADDSPAPPSFIVLKVQNKYSFSFSFPLFLKFILLHSIKFYKRQKSFLQIII